ncbi:hypothetical protein PMAYCL1PPCAC_31069, partial [Pristionchus mayeri]
GQTTGGETAGETQSTEATTLPAIGESTLSVPVDITTASAEGGETSGVPGGEATTAISGEGTEASTVGGGEATTGETATTAAGEGESAATTAAPTGEETTRGGETTSSSIGGETIPTDFPQPGTVDGGESSTPESGASGDTTTLTTVTDQSTPGDDLVTPPPLIPTDFVTPGTLVPDETTTDSFVIGQYSSTDFIPDNSFGISATISGVQLPVAPTPLVAQQSIEPDFPDPEALTSLEKRSPLSRTESFRVRLRMPRKVNASDSSFTRELTRNVIEIANRTLESTSAIADRRKRNIEVDPIILNITDVNQVDDNEAEVRFALGLHAFDDIDSLIDALKKSIPNGSENGIVIIERLEVYTTIERSSSSWILPVILIIAVILIFG